MAEEAEKKTTPPASFNLEWYKTTLKIIQQNRKNFPDDAELQLAEASGGLKFRRALDKNASAPCEENTNCELCWLASYCKHKDKPEEVRLAEVDTEKQAKESKAKKKKESVNTLSSNDLDDIIS